MTFFKNLPGCLQVFRIFRALIPRKGKKCLNISPQNAALSGIGAGDFKTADFFENAILYFLGSSKLFGFSADVYKRQDVPQVTLLAHELHKAGVDIPEGILTKEELVGALCR